MTDRQSSYLSSVLLWCNIVFRNGALRKVKEKRPVTDIVGTESPIGSLTLVASRSASVVPAFLS